MSMYNAALASKFKLHDFKSKLKTYLEQLKFIGLTGFPLHTNFDMGSVVPNRPLLLWTNLKSQLYNSTM